MREKKMGCLVSRNYAFAPAGTKREERYAVQVLELPSPAGWSTDVTVRCDTCGVQIPMTVKHPGVVALEKLMLFVAIPAAAMYLTWLDNDSYDFLTLLFAPGLLSILFVSLPLGVIWQLGQAIRVNLKFSERMEDGHKFFGAENQEV